MNVDGVVVCVLPGAVRGKVWCLRPELHTVQLLLFFDCLAVWPTDPSRFLRHRPFYQLPWRGVRTWAADELQPQWMRDPPASGEYWILKDEVGVALDTRALREPSTYKLYQKLYIYMSLKYTNDVQIIYEIHRWHTHYRDNTQMTYKLYTKYTGDVHIIYIWNTQVTHKLCKAEVHTWRVSHVDMKYTSDVQIMYIWQMNDDHGVL